MTPSPQLLAVEPDGLVVVLKPAGVVVHATRPEDADDVLAWARAQPALPRDLAPLHRLDRETSGVLLLAADAEVRGRVGRWFAEGANEKAYLALVHGHPHDKGIVRRPLPDARRGGRPLPAVTRFRTLARLPGTALLRVRPEHGRKHQIRRHLQAVGHPVVGDTRWGPERFRPVPGFPGRLWLHAASLALPDGRTFTAPLPPELEAHLELLRGLGG